MNNANMELTMRDILAQTAARTPAADALNDPMTSQKLSFATWNDLTTRVAGGLADAGVEPGDHVSLVMKDSIELVTTLFAVVELGAVANPISYRAPSGRLDYILDHADSRCLVYDEAAAETIGALETVPEVLVGPTELDDPSTYRTYDALTEGGDVPAVELSSDEPCLLLYTSGTTGKPKGVRHTHSNVIQADLQCLPYNRLRPADTNLALGPLYHVGPLLCNFMPALHVGATNLVLPDFDPETVIRYIDEEGLSALWAIPTHVNALLESNAIEDCDGTEMRMIQYSGATMPRDVVRECREHFTDVDLINAYGTTEIIFGTLIYPEDHDDHLGSIGHAVPNAEVRLVDPDDPIPGRTVPQGETGELLVRTPTCMEGYWQAPDKTDEAIVDGWYRTGDLARRDDEGFVYFVDRKDSMIVTGGENVYPAEVENVLHDHPAVASAAVVGEPHEEWGEIVTAFIVPADDVSEDDVDRYFQESDDIEDFKRPRRYVLRDTLPKTQSGKIDRQELEAAVNEA